MKLQWSGWALAACAFGISSVAHAAPPSAAMLSNACAGCHGTHGGSAGPSMPSLASQSKHAIVEAMKKFKSGERPSTIMGRIAKGYSDADFDAMGEFFSKQKPHFPQQAFDSKLADKGGLLQEKHCGRCHVDDGKDGKEDTPVTAGQWLPYLQIQMEQYLSGKRKMPEKMAEKVKPLSKEELDAVMHFYASAK